jgi:carbamoyl-phosphate synthase small subunit
MHYAISTIKELMATDIPMFGICLGHQLLALASDVPTYKMHHGHRGINHPVKNVNSGLCEITTQNHGFGVSPEHIKARSEDIEITHVNLNDDTIEGIRLKGKPAFSVQFHPEASPGPHDSRYLFDEFIELMKIK